jgi:hypothetical protein
LDALGLAGQPLAGSVRVRLVRARDALGSRKAAAPLRRLTTRLKFDSIGGGATRCLRIRFGILLMAEKMPFKELTAAIP